MKRKHSNCQQCEKPLPDAVRERRGDSGTFMPVEVWLTSLEDDPFCSAECSRKFNGVTYSHEQLDYGSCPDCGKKHHYSRSKATSDRCGDCAKKVRYVRRFFGRWECAGCGADVRGNPVTHGCQHCHDRARRRAKRQTNEAFRERENERARQNRAKQKLARLAAPAVAGGSIEPPGNGSPLGGGEDFSTMEEAA